MELACCDVAVVCQVRVHERSCGRGSGAGTQEGIQNLHGRARLFCILVPRRTPEHAVGNSAAQRPPQGDVCRPRDIDRCPQRLSIDAMVVNVVAYRQRRVEFVEELVATATGKDAGAARLRGKRFHLGAEHQIDDVPA